MKRQELSLYLKKHEINFEKYQKPISLDRDNFEVPNYFECPISLEIMEDPVTTIYGNSYEKQSILKSIKFNGFQDPLTGKNIYHKHVLTLNKNLKKYIKIYVKENPWVFDLTNYSPHNLSSIKFV